MVSSIANKIASAYDFDKHAQGFNSAVLNEPIIVGLYSNAVLQKGGGNAAGTQYFIANVNPYLLYLENSNRQQWAWFVTGHELEHLIMNRLNSNVSKVPVLSFRRYCLFLRLPLCGHNNRRCP